MTTARYDIRESTRTGPLFHDGLFRFSHPDEVRGYIVAIQVFLDESGKKGASISCAPGATSPAQRGRLKDDPLYAEVEGCIRLVMARTHTGEPLQVCFDSSEEYAVAQLRTEV